jgi:hypothetical protein
MTNKEQIIKYYETLLLASRTNEPVTYHYLTRQAEGTFNRLSSDDLELMERLTDESGIEKHKKDAIALHIIDSLKKENNYMTTIFETKEQYIAFRTKWKEIHNELRKQKVVAYTASHYNGRGYENFDVKESALNIYYHMIYLTATGTVDKAMSNAIYHTWNKIFWGSGSTSGFKAAFDRFGDALTPEQRHTIAEQIHQLAYHRRNY